MQVTLYGITKRMQGTLGNTCFECEHIGVVTDEYLTESLIVAQDGDSLDVEWTNRKNGALKECNSKTARLKQLADAMYDAAQYLTIDASRLQEAMREYKQFIRQNKI